MSYIGSYSPIAQTKSWKFTGDSTTDVYTLSGFPNVNYVISARDLFVQEAGIMLVSPDEYTFDSETKQLTFITPPALNATVLVRVLYIL
jgi:hypothetical protein